MRAGRCAVLVIVGEPGIGKTTMLAYARGQAEAAGLAVLEGRGAQHECDVPFGLVVDALDDRVAVLHPRRLESLGPGRLAELAAVLPSAAHRRPTAVAPAPAERFRYHRAVRALLELLGRERPLAVLLDDVHWADEGSLELVLDLLRRPPQVGHLLAIALRPSGATLRLLDALRRCPMRISSPLLHSAMMPCARWSMRWRTPRCAIGSCAKRAATRSTCRSWCASLATPAGAPGRKPGLRTRVQIGRLGTRRIRGSARPRWRRSPLPPGSISRLTRRACATSLRDGVIWYDLEAALRKGAR